MKFCIVHYNTPELTACLCGSIIKQHDNPEIIIFDNSDKRPFKEMAELFNCVYYDNTQGQLINFNEEIEKFPERNAKEQKELGCNFGSAKHSMSVQWLLDNLDDEFILCDSDILFKKPVDFVDKNKLCVSDVDEYWKQKNIFRIYPFIAYMNTPLIKDKHIRFYDGNRMHGLQSTGRYWMYDTGASFYEDVLACGQDLHKRINYNDYIIHFQSGSWRTFDKSKLVKYVNLWN